MKPLEMQPQEVVPSGKIRRLLRSKMAILFGVIASLLGLAVYIGEKIIRADPELIPVKAQIRSFTNSNAGKYNPVPDPDIGFLGPPHLRTRFVTEDYEFLQETDAHGFPNRMPWPESADIVVLGDSLLEGAGVGIDGQFSTLVSQALPIKGILNLGLAGAAPNRQLRAFRKFGASLRPGLVISCIFLASDLNGQLHFDSWLKEGAKPDYHQFRLNLSDVLRPKSFWTRVQRKSYVAGKLSELTLRWWGIPDRIHFSSGPAIFLNVDNLWGQPAGLDLQDRRLLSMIESLKEMRALSQSGGAAFLVMLIPSKEEIYGASFIPAVMKPAQTLEQRLKEEGFSVLSTYDAVRERAKHQSAFFPRDIHLNEFGNQIVSDSLVNWIKQARIFPGEKNSLASRESRLPLRAGSS